MRALRVVVWTGLCVGLGVWLGAQTPVGGLWREGAPGLADRAKSLVGEVRATAATAKAQSGPKERYTPEERAAVDALIAAGRTK